MTETIKSRRGRELVVLGDPALLTMDRLSEFTARIDSDPRIVSLSLLAGPHRQGQWLRASSGAGPLIAIATDAADLAHHDAARDPQHRDRHPKSQGEDDHHPQRCHRESVVPHHPEALFRR